jgi:hypothetical protein
MAESRGGGRRWGISANRRWRWVGERCYGKAAVRWANLRWKRGQRVLTGDYPWWRNWSEGGCRWGTGQAGIGVGGEVGGHREATTELRVTSPGPDGDQTSRSMTGCPWRRKVGDTKLVRARWSSTCLAVGSTCSAVTRAHGTAAPKVLRHGDIALGRGARGVDAWGAGCAGGSRGGESEGRLGLNAGRGGVRRPCHHGVATRVHASWPVHATMGRLGPLASGPYQFKLFYKFWN